MDTDNTTTEKATFGAGCFWCTEAFFQSMDGVEKVISGYMGGDLEDPTYRAVCSGTTGHAEVAQVHFDPKVISFRELVDTFWKIHDPTTLNRQGNDVGTQYRSAIFTHSPEQKDIATASKAEAAKNFDDPIVTEIIEAGEFYEAEDYHQDYFQNHPYAPYSLFIRSKMKKLDMKP